VTAVNRLLVRRRSAWLVILAFLLTALSACSHLGPLGRMGAPFFKHPEFRFDDVGVTNVSFSGFTLGFRIEARNPNRFSMTLRNWRYAVSLNKLVFLEGTVDDEVKIQGKGSKIITIPVEVSYGNISKLLKGTFDSRSLKYDFRSDFDLATWAGSGTAPFQTKGEVRLPRKIGRGLLEDLLGGRHGGGEGSGVINEEDLRRWKREYEERMRDRLN
jgi:LEA14-like dessication related protein